MIPINAAYPRRPSGRPSDSVSEWLEVELRKMAMALASEGRDLLPSERELAIRYNVNRLTLRKVLKKLELAQILVGQRGGSRFVSRNLFCSCREMRDASRAVYDENSINSVSTVGLKVGCLEYSSSREYMDEQFRLFSKNVPGCQIIPVPIKADEFSSLADSGGLPDVFSIKASELARLSEKSCLFELDDLYRMFFGDNSPLETRLVDACKSGGRLYGIPQEASIPVIYCNSDLLGGIPDVSADDIVSWNDIIAAAKSAEEQMPDGAHFMSIPCVYALLVYFGVFSPDSFPLPSGYDGEAAAFFVDWVKKMSVIPNSMHISVLDKSPSLDRFMSGRIGLFMHGTYLAPYIRRSTGFKSRILRAPISPEGCPDINIVAWAMRKDSAHQLHAFRWIEHILNHENQICMAERNGNLPAMEAAVREAYAGAFEDSKIVLGDYARGRCNILPNSFQQKLEREVWFPEFMRLWNGLQTPDETLRNMKNGHEFIRKLF